MDPPITGTPIPRHFGNCQKIHLRWGVLSDSSYIRISRTRYSYLTTNYSTISSFISFIIYYYILYYYIYTIYPPHPFPIPYTTIIYTTPLSFPYTFPYTFNFPFSTVLFSNTFSPCLPQLFQSPLIATPFSS